MNMNYEAIADLQQNPLSVADFWFCVHNTVVNGHVNIHDANMA